MLENSVNDTTKNNDAPESAQNNKHDKQRRRRLPLNPQHELKQPEQTTKPEIRRDIPASKVCDVCGQAVVVMVDLDGFIQWHAGALMKDAFPYLTPEERRMLLSGTHPQCQPKIHLVSHEEDTAA